MITLITGQPGAGKSAQQIDEVVLVGGSTRIPRVQKLVSEWKAKGVSV